MTTTDAIALTIFSSYGRYAFDSGARFIILYLKNNRVIIQNNCVSYNENKD